MRFEASSEALLAEYRSEIEEALKQAQREIGVPVT
jgi:hypothetical protein